eukprot:COSAG01_NODE_69680_length_260_cov_1.732919_1_plen_61_part_10
MHARNRTASSRRITLQLCKRLAVCAGVFVCAGSIVLRHCGAAGVDSVRLSQNPYFPYYFDY